MAGADNALGRLRGRSVRCSSGAVRAAYEQRFAAHQEALSRSCRQRAIPCFQVRSDQPFEDVVLRLFRGGGLLR